MTSPKMNSLDSDPDPAKQTATESPSASAVRKMEGIADSSSESTSLLKQQSSESGTAYASDGVTERVVSSSVPKHGSVLSCLSVCQAFA